MRDEVLAELSHGIDNFAFRVYCHVSGGFIVGSAGWRYNIFRSELPLVLEAIRMVTGSCLKRTRSLTIFQYTYTFIPAKTIWCKGYTRYQYISPQRPTGSKMAVCGVSGPEVAVRDFEFPPLSAEDIDAAVQLEASQVCPFNAADSAVDYHLMPNGDNKIRGVLVAATNTLTSIQVSFA
jgi:hypothetical protein